MRLRRIDLPAFGCLSDFGAELSPGLNLFVGENEAGKSTLQAAISALLYGFFENERALKAENERYERFRPWTGSVYRGTLEYELSNGDRYEVRRDFAADVATQLIDVATGLDVASKFGRGRHGNVPFARKQFGMSRGVFQSCAFVSQGEIFDVTQGASPSQIGDAVAALADSAGRDVSAARAIKSLKSVESRIGSDAARTAELPRARQHLARAQAELAAGEEARAQAARTARELEERRVLVRQLQEERARTEALALRTQIATLRSRLDAVAAETDEAERAESEAEALSAGAGFPASLRDEMLALKGRWSQLLNGIERLRGDRDGAAAAISDNERLEYETLREGVGTLTDEQVRALETVAFEPTARGVTAAIGDALRAIVRWIAGRVRRILRQDDPPTAEAAPAVSAEEARALLDRHRRFLSLRPRSELAGRLTTEVAGQEAALETIEGQLRNLMAAAGISEANVDEGLRAFEAAAQDHARHQSALARAAEARHRCDATLAGRTIEETETRLADCERALSDLLAKRPELADIETDRSLEQLAKERDRLRDELQEAQLEEGRLEQKVDLVLEQHRPASELEEEAARWRREVERLEKARAAVALARSQIEEAMVQVYRDFAPAVNTFLSEGIEKVTEGRYSRAHVDPASLRVSLLLPETGEVITDPPVSHGTRTMVYVLMRVGLAQHMSAIGEPVPLVLDDPFVDLDSRRLPRMMDYLLTLSERMQVLFFTKEASIVRWFEEHASGPEHRVHGLAETRLSRASL
ncbi:MAG: AAA family ATPase [Chloroflexi bacterium]|nr:AAA family ATPase [Chloroflexota bacterium]